MADVSPSFAERVRNPKLETRLAALGEALKPGAALPAAEAVAPLVEDPEETVRQLAVVLLGRMGAAGVPALSRALGERQPAVVRAFAASILAQAGPAAASAAEPLGKCLESSEEKLGITAGLALSRIGSGALPVLRRALAAREAATAVLAARALGWMGKDGSPALEDLKRVAAAPGPEPRMAALAAIVAVTGDAGRGLPPLTAIVQGSDRSLRREAIERIGELRELGRGAAPALRRCLEDSAGPVRAAAALALARVKSLEAETREGLSRLRKDPDPDVRVNVAIALAPFGASASAALQQLKSDPDARVAAIAAAGLHAIAAATAS